MVVSFDDLDFFELGYKRQPYGWQWDKEAEVNQEPHCACCSLRVPGYDANLEQDRE